MSGGRAPGQEGSGSRAERQSREPLARQAESRGGGEGARAQAGAHAGPDPLCPVDPEGCLDSVLRNLGRKLVQNPSERVGPSSHRGFTAAARSLCFLGEQHARWRLYLAQCSALLSCAPALSRSVLVLQGSAPECHCPCRHALLYSGPRQTGQDPSTQETVCQQVPGQGGTCPCLPDPASVQGMGDRGCGQRANSAWVRGPWACVACPWEHYEPRPPAPRPALARCSVNGSRAHEGENTASA